MKFVQFDLFLARGSDRVSIRQTSIKLDGAEVLT